MITVELNGKRVEVENEKEARKALAKMVRDEKKASAERAKNWEIARLHAQAEAFWFLDRMVRQKPMPSTFTFMAPLAAHSPCAVDSVNEFGRYLLTVDTKQGKAQDSISDYWGCIVDASGACRILFTKSSSQPVEAYAVGAHNGILVLVEVYGLMIAHFAKQEAQ